MQFGRYVVVMDRARQTAHIEDISTGKITACGWNVYSAIRHAAKLAFADSVNAMLDSFTRGSDAMPLERIAALTAMVNQVRESI